jgi:hypothetical protein
VKFNKWKILPLLLDGGTEHFQSPRSESGFALSNKKIKLLKAILAR